MTLGPRKYDLSECDREPIHQLGFIQDFGGLIAVNADWMVAHVSANAAAMLGLSVAIQPGQQLSAIMTDKAAERLKLAVKSAAAPDSVERIFGQRLVRDGALFDIALHCSGPLVIIEFEPHDAAEAARYLDYLNPLMRQIDNVRDIDELCRRGASMVKDLLGFDRVMVYRFHADLSGEVAAEAKEAHLEAFLGLRYPHTDIPQQARELYLRNRFRIISDINAEPVPIEPAQSVIGDPVDLSMSMLRAVSPIHIEYLQNMGVGASLSISIIVGGKLWGLFACHHYSRKVLPFPLRTVAELFSQLFSMALERTLNSARDRLLDRARGMHDKLMIQLAGGTSLTQSLPELEKILDSVIPHDGMSVQIDDTYKAQGAAPTAEEFQALLPALNGAPTSKVIATNALAAQLKSASAFLDRAAGALIIPVSRSPRDYLVLWRREEAQKVKWAGRPDKTVEQTDDGVRLSPRKSFALWEETVAGQSAQWTDDEMQFAESLRATLIEVILRLTDQAVRDRSRAQEQQELLIAELNHRVRNILNLIRGLVKQSQHDASNIEDYSAIIGGRINALANAHDNITKQNWSPAPLSSLIEAEVEAYLQEKVDRMEIEGEDVLIAPEAYTVLALVMHEMVTNSAKYGSLADSRGKLRIILNHDSDGNLQIAWRESGGPQVSQPTRRGFGSTIIERSIPFELKGEATVRYEPAGLEADFLLPARYVGQAVPDPQVPGNGQRSTTETSDHAETSDVPSHVLVVEDSMIIALDTEDSLKRLGVAVIDMASSVAGALEQIEKASPKFAIVDFNLGAETSLPVIEELNRRGIPHILATGYGENTVDLSGEFTRGIITKPYGKVEIENAIKKG